VAAVCQLQRAQASEMNLAWSWIAMPAISGAACDSPENSIQEVRQLSARQDWSW
jgi:hypothetical protein